MNNLDAQTMQVIGALVAIGSAIVGGYKLYQVLFGDRMDDFAESLHKLKGNVPSLGMFNERNAAVDKLLEDRRGDVEKLHVKIDSKAADLGDKIDAQGDKLGEKIDRLSEIMLARLK